MKMTSLVLLSIIWLLAVGSAQQLPEQRVLDLLSLPDRARAGRFWADWSAADEVYVAAAIRLPPKTGGLLLGVYGKRDNKKYLEVAVVAKVNKVSLRFWRPSDGKTDTVQLANADVLDGRRHSLLLRLGDFRGRGMRAELYADCRSVDAAEGAPRPPPLPAEPDALEIRHGQKAYARAQGAVESLRVAFGGTLAQAGALVDCAFPRDSTHNLASGELHTVLAEHTKALIGQMVLFNQMLGELRQDVKEQVKEMSLLRNAISECQACGFQEPRLGCWPNPCHPGVACAESPQFPGFTCGPCPPGTLGNGTRCDDVDECQARPCFLPSACVNTPGGFRCDPCPAGLRGAPLAGTGLHYAQTRKQECVDVDECTELANACVQNSVCVNTPGSFHCGACKAGYHGDQSLGCLPRRSCATLTFDPCDAHADCEMERSGLPICTVSESAGPWRTGPDRMGSDRSRVPPGPALTPACAVQGGLGGERQHVQRGQRPGRLPRPPASLSGQQQALQTGQLRADPQLGSGRRRRRRPRRPVRRRRRRRRHQERGGNGEYRVGVTLTQSPSQANVTSRWRRRWRTYGRLANAGGADEFSTATGQLPPGSQQGPAELGQRLLRRRLRQLPQRTQWRAERHGRERARRRLRPGHRRRRHSQRAGQLSQGAQPHADGPRSRRRRGRLRHLSRTQQPHANRHRRRLGGRHLRHQPRHGRRRPPGRPRQLPPGPQRFSAGLGQRRPRGRLRPGRRRGRRARRRRQLQTGGQSPPVGPGPERRGRRMRAGL
ncbi:thrombospondin-3a-like isoform X4 [Stigmatopora argus]